MIAIGRALGNGVLLVGLVGVLLGCEAVSEAVSEATSSGNDEADPIVYGYEVRNTFPHDPNAFTQGLLYSDAASVFYEGTGRYGESDVREVAPATGEVRRRRELPDRYFGEGLALWGDRLYQLTWKSNRGFVYDRASFERLGEVRYETEGWGLTHDGERFIMSDGSATLSFRDPETFEETGTVTVKAEGERVTNLNELEYIEGRVYANVWRTDRIAIIDPSDGRVAAWIDLEGLLPEADRTDQTGVLNGIAYDADRERLFVTGKNWPKLFEIATTE